MFCGWWLGNVVCLSASCCWFHFRYLQGRKGEDLVLGRPLEKKASCEAVCVLRCVVLNRINPLGWRCVCFAVCLSIYSILRAVAELSIPGQKWDPERWGALYTV
jgi:hypothetical protein